MSILFDQAKGLPHALLILYLTTTPWSIPFAFQGALH